MKSLTKNAASPCNNSSKYYHLSVDHVDKHFEIHPSKFSKNYCLQLFTGFPNWIRIYNIYLTIVSEVFIYLLTAVFKLKRQFFLVHQLILGHRLSFRRQYIESFNW